MRLCWCCKKNERMLDFIFPVSANEKQTNKQTKNPDPNSTLQLCAQFSPRGGKWTWNPVRLHKDLWVRSDVARCKKIFIPTRRTRKPFLPKLILLKDIRADRSTKRRVLTCSVPKLDFWSSVHPVPFPAFYPVAAAFNQNDVNFNFIQFYCKQEGGKMSVHHGKNKHLAVLKNH